MSAWVPRGRVWAVGVLVDPALIGEDAARRRVLGLYSAGTQVFGTPRGYAVRWAQPRWLHEPYAGAPLLQLDGRVSTAPLPPGDPAPPVSARVGGALEALPLVEVVDPSAWLAFELPVVEGEPLGVVEVGEPVGLPPVPVGFGVAAHPDRLEVARRLSERRSLWTERAVRGLARLSRWLGGGDAADGPPRRSWFGRLDAWLGSLADRIGLSAVLGARYRRYFEDLIRRFADGDLIEALRRALPLGDDRGEGGGGAAGWFASLPSRGALDLSMVPRTSGRGWSIGAGPDLFATLRKVYLGAAERLEREGQVDLAAFVLDELLRDPQAAVDLLERHDRWSTAAGLAEARKLAPGLVVRLWWRAGDRERARAIARREQAWADAIGRSSAADPETASALRASWATVLAAQGRYGAAVEVAADDAALAGLAAAWMHAGIAQGGAPGAALLVRNLAHAPEALDRLAEVAESWATAPDPVAFEALIGAIGDWPPTAELAALTRRVARIAVGMPAIPGAEIGRMAARQRAGPILADLPADPPRTEVHLQVPADLVGAGPILDAVRAIDGSWLVAKDDGGVWWLDPLGRRIGQFEWPTWRIVTWGGGNRFVLVGGRNDRHRLARLDLATRRVEPWTEVRATWLSLEADGDLWWVADGEDLYAIDLLADGWRHLWGVRDCGAPVWWVAAGSEAVFALIGEERWRWSRPGYTLRERVPTDSVAVNAAGDMLPRDALAFGIWPSAPFATVHRGDGGRTCRFGSSRVVLRGAGWAHVRVEGSAFWTCDDLGRLVFVDGKKRSRVMCVFP